MLIQLENLSQHGFSSASHLTIRLPCHRPGTMDAQTGSTEFRAGAEIQVGHRSSVSRGNASSRCDEKRDHTQYSRSCGRLVRSSSQSCLSATAAQLYRDVGQAEHNPRQDPPAYAESPTASTFLIVGCCGLACLWSLSQSFLYRRL